MVILLTKDASETSRTCIDSESCLPSRIEIAKRWSCCQAFEVSVMLSLCLAIYDDVITHVLYTIDTAECSGDRMLKYF